MIKITFLSLTNNAIPNSRAALRPATPTHLSPRLRLSQGTWRRGLGAVGVKSKAKAARRRASGVAERKQEIPERKPEQGGARPFGGARPLPAPAGVHGFVLLQAHPRARSCRRLARKGLVPLWDLRTMHLEPVRCRRAPEAGGAGGEEPLRGAEGARTPAGRGPGRGRGAGQARRVEPHLAALEYT